MRWHVLMSSAGTGITIRQSMRLTFAMLFASNFLPTTIGGDVVRLAGAIRLGFDQAISVASLVVDRLIGMAGMAMGLIFAIPSYVYVYQDASGLHLMAISWLTPLANKITRFLQELTASGESMAPQAAFPFYLTCIYLGAYALHFFDCMAVITWNG